LDRGRIKAFEGFREWLFIRLVGEKNIVELNFIFSLDVLSHTS